MTKYDLRKEYTDKVSKKMSEIGRHQIDPTPTNTSLDKQSNTDRNGDPIVGKILDIIDEKRSRYAVAVAVAEYLAAQVQQGKIEELTGLPLDNRGKDGIWVTMSLEERDCRIAALQTREEK